MAAGRRSAFTPEQIAAAEQYRRERPQKLRLAATQLKVFRHCPQKACRRQKSCCGPDALACLEHYVHRVLSEEQRLIFQLTLLRMGAGAGADEALDGALAHYHAVCAEEEAQQDAQEDAQAEVEAVPAGEPACAPRGRPEPVPAPPEDEAARAARVRRLRAEPRRGLTPFRRGEGA